MDQKASTDGPGGRHLVFQDILRVFFQDHDPKLDLQVDLTTKWGPKRSV